MSYEKFIATLPCFFKNFISFDFINKEHFATDDYVLPKYKTCIDLINFIFSKSKIEHLNTCNLQFVDSLEKVKEEIIDKYLRNKYFISRDFIFEE